MSPPRCQFYPLRANDPITVLPFSLSVTHNCPPVLPVRIHKEAKSMGRPHSPSEVELAANSLNSLHRRSRTVPPGSEENSAERSNSKHFDRSISSIQAAEDIRRLQVHVEMKLTPTSYHQVVTAMVLRAEERFGTKLKYFS